MECMVIGAVFGGMSSSACSGIAGSMLRPDQDGVPGYGSSTAERKGLRLRPALRGDEDRRIGLVAVTM